MTTTSGMTGSGSVGPSGGGNQKSEYDDVPGENETPFTLHKLELPAASKSSPGNVLPGN